jgi:aspartyl-tRNA(Asn)/glutamyl-tRNA(Gln) amidotransferase subunit C
MSSIDSKSIERIAHLAHLHISDDEKVEYSKQINEIISYVEAINTLDTKGIEPTDHIVELSNVFRADTVLPSIDTAEIEKMAPSYARGHIVVPKIIESES